MVHRHARFVLERVDWSDVAESELDAALGVWMEDNRKRGFDLATCPLTRGALFRVTDGYRLVWATHHVVSDGWSLPVLLGDLFALYTHFTKGSALRLEPPPRYGAFIDWLATPVAERSRKRSTGRTLAGLEEPTLLDPRGAPTTTWARTPPALARAVGARSGELARNLRVTLSTVVHAAWAIVLGRYTGKSDVLFGSTTSGRAAPLAHIERMVGLFINAVPVRVRVAHGPLSRWLEELQEQFNELRSHEHVPLTDVHAWSDIPRSNRSSRASSPSRTISSTKAHGRSARSASAGSGRRAHPLPALARRRSRRTHPPRR